MYKLKSKVIDLYDYKNIDLHAVVEPFTFSDEEMKEAATKKFKRVAKLENVSEISLGDFVTLSCEAESSKFTKNHLNLCVGKGLYSAEFEEKIIGFEVASEKTIDVSGEEVKVTIEDIKRRVIPELTDEAVRLLEIEGVTTVEAFKEMILDEEKAEYRESYAEALTLYLLGEINGNSTFELDDEELAHDKERSLVLAKEMLKSAGLNPETATDEEVMAVSGRTKQEHYEFMIANGQDGFKSSVVGAKVMAEEGVELTCEKYEEYIESLMGETGKSREEVTCMITHEAFVCQQSADYMLYKMENYAKEYLNKEI